MVPCTSQAQLSLFAARALVFGLFPEPWSPRRIPLLPRLHPDAIWPTALPRQETEKKKSPPGARLDVLSEQDTREASTATRGRHAARGVSREESRIAGNPKTIMPRCIYSPEPLLQDAACPRLENGCCFMVCVQSAIGNHDYHDCHYQHHCPLREDGTADVWSRLRIPAGAT